MANPLHFMKRVLAGKVETTFGTAESLTSAEAGFRVMDRDLKIVGETVQRENQGALGVAANVGGALSTELSFTTHVHGKGSAGVPAWGFLFQGCGFSLSSQTYTASSDTSTWKGLTFGEYIDGLRTLARGMMGSARIVLERGMPATINWSFKGGWQADPTDTAILSGMSYDAANPPVWAGTGTLTLGGASTYTRVNRVEIDLGCDVQLIEDPNSAGGFLGGWIANRITRIKMDPEVVAMATKNFWNDQRTPTPIAFSTVIGTAANNICTIACSSMQLASAPGKTNRGGKLAYDADFFVNSDGLSVVFT